MAKATTTTKNKTTTRPTTVATAKTTKPKTTTTSKTTTLTTKTVPVATTTTRMTTTTKTKKTLTAQERYNMIANLAYTYAQERGFTNGSQEADWLRAENEIDNQTNK